MPIRYNVRVRAGRGRVFIYKAVQVPLGPESGFFRIVLGPHVLSPDQIINAKAEDNRLQPGQVIILDGDVVTEYPQAGGRISLCKPVSKVWLDM